MSEPIWNGPGQRHLTAGFERRVPDKASTAPKDASSFGYLCMTPRNGRISWTLYRADVLPMWWDKREKHWPGMRVHGITAEEFASGVDALMGTYGLAMLPPSSAPVSVAPADEMTATLSA